MAFYFKNTNRDIIMTDEDEEHHRNNDVCRVFKKILNLVKLEITVT